MALADSGAVYDPLVVGRDHFFEVLVGEHAGRRVAPQRADLGLEQGSPFVQKFRVTHPGVESATTGAGTRYNSAARRALVRAGRPRGHPAARTGKANQTGRHAVP